MPPLAQTRRQLIFMVYYENLYRRFRIAPLRTFANIFKELFGYQVVVAGSNNHQRGKYDSNLKGDIAPHTNWISSRSLKYLCKKFRFFRFTIESINQGTPLLASLAKNYLKQYGLLLLVSTYMLL
jgi:hypothetical protein